MGKVRVSALAKELDLGTRELLKILKDLGVPAKTASSSIDEDAAKIVKDVVKPPIKEAPKVVEIKKEEIAPVKKPAISIETEDISVKELAEKLQIRSSDLIKELMKKGVMANINQRIQAEMAKDIALSVGKTIEVNIPKSAAKPSAGVSTEGLILRPPVVTVMGHVDHGKTKLLDAIRKTRVAEGEAGGITQHIGAYQVKVHGKEVTFLDTPGHEAFTALRARGASVTDIVILVVAADDGVKPQTLEAVDHARAAKVPVIVAINKIDKPEANPDRVKQQLADLGLIPEEWGGKTVMVPTSAKQEKGINEILEMILLVAELAELKANPKAVPVGVVIESRLDKGRGPVASVLMKNGTLRVGDPFVIGATYGKVRALFNDKGARMESAGPSTPVEVLGSIDVPDAGDLLQVVASEKEARDQAEKKQETISKVSRAKVFSLEDYSKHVKEGETQDLNLVIKVDVQGSLDAIARSVQDLAVGNIRINIIHQAVGPINESDITLARASDAVVIGFNVNYDGNAEQAAQREGVEVRQYDIIYKLIDDIKLAMEGLLAPEYEEVVVGHAEVRSIFKSSKIGVIAGCFVKDGKMTRGGQIRIFRGKEKVFEGKLESLKRFKDDVKAVEQNFECGVSISTFGNFSQGDIIEAFEIREKKRGKGDQGRSSS